MESVKYFDPAEGGGVTEADGYGAYVGAEDFARVTAEREALEQRIEEIKGLLRQASMLILDAELLRAIECTLTAEAVSPDEPKCLRCLDNKTVPGNISGGFVKDCPDCCGEEG